MVLRKTSSRSALLVAAFLFIICSAGALCQQSNQNSDAASTPANTKSQSDGNQSGQKQPSGKAAAQKEGSSGNNNAFPLAQSEAAAKADTPRTAQQSPAATPQTTGPANADSSQSGQRKRAASQDNPFPEAQSKAAAKADAGDAQQAQPGGSSSGGYSSSDDHLPVADLGQGTLGSHEKMDSFTRDQTQDGRIEDDLKVASFYMGNGNYRGALLRYQDAIQYDPQNDTALYGIAYALCKENRTSEAMADFESYAKNNPQGKYALKAEKMIAHPNKCMHNW